MTSIPGTLSSLAAPAISRMQLAPTSAVAPNMVGATSRGGLAGALSEIGAAMQASPPAIGTDPATMQAKVGALVDREVAEGKLTSDQASQLKQLFATSTATTGSGTTTGTAGAPAPGVGGAVQSVVDFLRDLRLTIKGQYAPAGATTAATPAGTLVSAFA